MPTSFSSVGEPGRSGAVSAAVRFNSPSPCACAFALIVVAAPIKSCFTWSGVAFGYFCRTSAAAPETSAADSEVPEPRKYAVSR